MHDERLRLAVGERAVARLELPARIENYTHGIRALDMADRELRIVRGPVPLPTASQSARSRCRC
jgi:hypothetical protein